MSDRRRKSLLLPIAIAVVVRIQILRFRCVSQLENYMEVIMAYSVAVAVHVYVTCAFCFSEGDTV